MRRGCGPGTLLTRSTTGSNRRLQLPRGLLWAPLLAIAACTPVPPAETPPPPPAPTVTPPPGGSVNDKLGGLEAVWHVRSAFNVAALSCAGNVAPDYNRFLSAHKPVLEQAFRDEEGRHGGNARALDTHMTRVYNYFSWPPAQAGFCSSVAGLMPRVTAMAGPQFVAEAPTLIAALDTAFIGPPAGSLQLVAAPASGKSTSGKSVSAKGAASSYAATAAAAPAVRGATAPAAAAPLVADRRIQLGAFSGSVRAKAAWALISGKSAEIARLKPRYQPVPGRAELVRLQTDKPVDHGQAIQLCALAAAAGFDCFTVAG